MSIKFTKIFVGVLFSGFVGGAVLSLLNGQGSRRPSSILAIQKSARFQPDQNKTAKPNQALEIWISPVGGFPSQNDQEVTLRAEITVQSRLDGDLTYQWSLPKGVELVSGVESDEIVGLQPGQTMAREISVLGFSSEGMPRNISLSVGATQRGYAIGSTAVFSSHPTTPDLGIGFRKPSSKNESTTTANSKVLSEDLPLKESRPVAPAGTHF